ncbi:hypothetical protein CLOM621_06836 [Clostridium sp. M62/1]|nr:hypothetical protein CLOM621_06836 [Clostridium sp. M62/1]
MAELFFYITGNFVLCYIKTLREDRTAAKRKMPLLRPAAQQNFKHQS